jgi:undecaprenyl-diphosphatase
MMPIIAQFFLSFSQEVVIVPLIIIGYICVDRKIFFHATCLILISILVNIALKATFQMPLPPMLNQQGFAFPSGHMQSSVTIYGWLFTATKDWRIKSIISMILTGIGCSLVYFGFHYYEDVLGAVFFSLLLIWLYKKALWYFSNRSFLFFIFIIANLILSYIVLIGAMKVYVLIQYCILIGVILSAYRFNISSGGKPT